MLPRRLMLTLYDAFQMIYRMNPDRMS